MNDLDLCLEVVFRSYQPLRHIRHWISQKPLETEASLSDDGRKRESRSFSELANLKKQCFTTRWCTGWPQKSKPQTFVHIFAKIKFILIISETDVTALFWSKRTHTSITGILSSDSCINIRIDCICVLFMSCLELRFVNFLLNEYCIVLYCIP